MKTVFANFMKNRRYRELRHIVETAQTFARTYGEEHGGYDMFRLDEANSYYNHARPLFEKFLAQRFEKLNTEQRADVERRAAYYAMTKNSQVQHDVQALTQEVSALKTQFAS